MRLRLFASFFATSLLLFPIVYAQEAQDREMVAQPASQQDVRAVQEELQQLREEYKKAQEDFVIQSEKNELEAQLEFQKARKSYEAASVKAESKLAKLQATIEKQNKEAIERETKRAQEDWVMKRNAFLFFGIVVLVCGAVFSFKFLKFKKPILIDPDIPQLKEYSVKYKTKKVPFIIKLKEGNKFKCIADLSKGEITAQIGDNMFDVPWKRRMVCAAKIADSMKNRTTIQ